MTLEKLVGTSADRDDDGLRLLFRPLGTDGNYELELQLSPAAVRSATAADHDFKQPTSPVILARCDAAEETLTTFPTVTNFGKHFLQPKYRDLTTIVLEEVMPLGEAADVKSIYYEEFDKGLIREPLAGFGVNYDMRFIIEAVERQVGIDTLRLCHEPGVQRYGEILSMSYSLFRKLRRDINRTHKQAIDLVNKSKADYLDATLNTILYPEYALPEGDGTGRPVADILAETLIGKSRSPEAEAMAAARTVKKSVKTLAETQPAELLDLRREIELVSLEELIELFEKKLGQVLQERHWQAFFKENSFILQLAFNLPALAFGDQVAVGGTRFDGSGGKFADYAVKLGLLGNLALIEIKTPKAPLLEKREYRGGIHAPSSELVGAVTQVLDQRHQLENEINDNKIKSKAFDIFTYDVRCIVIAGRQPASDEEKKSLELYRSNLRDVAVVTFDELLAKLKALHEFLSKKPEPPAPATKETDVSRPPWARTS